MTLDLLTSNADLRLNIDIKVKSCVVLFSKIVEKSEAPTRTYTHSEYRPLSHTRQYDARIACDHNCTMHLFDCKTQYQNRTERYFKESCAVRTLQSRLSVFYSLSLPCARVYMWVSEGCI